MSKILVTGFEPFGEDNFNPSAWILEKINLDPELSKQCETLLLPVTFGESHKPVLQALKNQNYKAWVGFGQAGGRAKISLERVALNWKESDMADNSGYLPAPGPLVEAKAPACYSKAPLQELKQVLESHQIPVEISFTAGAYVCNSLYYHVLSNLPESMWGVFVHVPYLRHQVENKKDKPFFDESEMWQAARLLLQKAIETKKSPSF